MVISSISTFFQSHQRLKWLTTERTQRAFYISYNHVFTAHYNDFLTKIKIDGMKLDGLVSWQGMVLFSLRSFSISIRFVLSNDSWDGGASPFSSIYPMFRYPALCMHTLRGVDYGI